MQDQPCGVYSKMMIMGRIPNLPHYPNAGSLCFSHTSLMHLLHAHSHSQSTQVATVFPCVDMSFLQAKPQSQCLSAKALKSLQAEDEVINSQVSLTR